MIVRTSLDGTRTDSGFFSLCRVHLRRFVSEYEIKLPPAPELMRAVLGCPSTSIRIVRNGKTRSTGHNWSLKFVYMSMLGSWLGGNGRVVGYGVKFVQ